MNESLINKLFEYIRDNNPDILFEIEATGSLTTWLSEKVSTVDFFIKQLKEQSLPDYQVEEICFESITKEFRPSKYNYIINVLEEEFESGYNRLLQSGLMQHEVINMVNHCNSVFADQNFSEENEDSQFIRYAIIREVSEYLQSNREVETVSNELQQPAETKG